MSKSIYVVDYMFETNTNEVENEVRKRISNQIILIKDGLVTAYFDKDNNVEFYIRNINVIPLNRNEATRIFNVFVVLKVEYMF